MLILSTIYPGELTNLHRWVKRLYIAISNSPHCGAKGKKKRKTKKKTRVEIVSIRRRMYILLWMPNRRTQPPRLNSKRKSLKMRYCVREKKKRKKGMRSASKRMQEIPTHINPACIHLSKDDNRSRHETVIHRICPHPPIHPAKKGFHCNLVLKPRKTLTTETEGRNPEGERLGIKPEKINSRIEKAAHSIIIHPYSYPTRSSVLLISTVFMMRFFCRFPETRALHDGIIIIAFMGR